MPDSNIATASAVAEATVEAYLATWNETDATAARPPSPAPGMRPAAIAIL